MTAKERADSQRPHKILTLDGGGIRGALSVEILAEIEIIAKRKGANTLADYFDYIAGTSTGAILAAGLSLGWSVAKLREFYEEQGKTMFEKASLINRLRFKYDDEPLAAFIRQETGKETNGEDVRLESDKLQTLLMMVMRNATTDSPWPVSNNPYAKYNDKSLDDNNGRIPLWQLIRASTAAPVYFPPERVEMGNKDFLFVDGGITCYNNPSFQTFLMATAEPYRLNWKTGENELLLVSVGTGSSPLAKDDLESSDLNLLYNAQNIPAALMNAASVEQDFLCRIFGNCLWGEPIDSEVGDMCAAHGSLCRGPGESKLFNYVRYNAELTREGLDSLELGDIKPREVRALDSIKGLSKLQRIGEAVGKMHVHEDHFNGF